MTLYLYIKAPPAKNNYFLPNKARPLLLKTLPLLSVVSGLILLLIVIWPILSYKMLVFNKEKSRFIIPISEESLIKAKGFINPARSAVLSAQEQQIKPKIIKEVDYNLIKNWFPTAPLPVIKPNKITHYSLSIPKLKIKDAVVSIGSQEIKKTLIQYPGTALPGEYGNTVIFGHSVLPVFYNPKNYKTIFSTLPTLDKGDKIYIYFDGIEYVYEVEDYFEVGPENVAVLEQRFNQQVLSLITCVPPGTYQKRGVVKARLKAL